MKTYTFTALCKSGAYKTTTFQASGYLNAREKLTQFIANN
jgi:hypothetical protein